MNTNTGQLYDSRDAALADLKEHEKPEDVVEVYGTREAVQRLSEAVQQANTLARRRAANKAARKSRRRNR